MLSACGERMYSSTICFQRRRHSQPRKKLWTFLILAISGSSSSSEVSPRSWLAFVVRDTWGKSLHSFFKANSYKGKWNWVFWLKVLKKKITSVRNFLISSVSSSQCWVYCHLAVFSLSTTWSKCKCFCSNSSICKLSLLKLKSITLLAKYCKKIRYKRAAFVYMYLACFMPSIQALHSEAVSALNSYCRWFSRRYIIAKQYWNGE